MQHFLRNTKEKKEKNNIRKQKIITEMLCKEFSMLFFILFWNLMYVKSEIRPFNNLILTVKDGKWTKSYIS